MIKETINKYNDLMVVLKGAGCPLAPSDATQSSNIELRSRPDAPCLAGHNQRHIHLPRDADNLECNRACKPTFDDGSGADGDAQKSGQASIVERTSCSIIQSQSFSILGAASSSLSNNLLRYVLLPKPLSPDPV